MDRLQKDQKTISSRTRRAISRCKWLPWQTTAASDPNFDIDGIATESRDQLPKLTKRTVEGQKELGLSESLAGGRPFFQTLQQVVLVFGPP